MPICCSTEFAWQTLTGIYLSNDPDAAYKFRLTPPDDISNSIAGKTTLQIAAVRYYNHGGQQVLSPEAERIVIQHITYTDGTMRSRKIVNRR